MNTKDAILKTLDVSTAHIEFSTAKELDTPTDVFHELLYVRANINDGWQLVVPSLGDTDIAIYLAERAMDGRPALGRILKLADSFGCTYVHLHGDGFILDELPKHDW